MSQRLLLVSDNASRRVSLAPLIGGLGYNVSVLSAEDLPEAKAPSCALAVLDMPITRLAPVIAFLKQYQPEPKLLVLVPFDVQGVEMRLLAIGADDVLSLPVTKPRLEMTLINLMRIHALEKLKSGERTKQHAQ